MISIQGQNKVNGHLYWFCKSAQRRSIEINRREIYVNLKKMANLIRYLKDPSINHLSEACLGWWWWWWWWWEEERKLVRSSKCWLLLYLYLLLHFWKVITSLLYYIFWVVRSQNILPFILNSCFSFLFSSLLTKSVASSSLQLHHRCSGSPNILEQCWLYCAFKSAILLFCFLLLFFVIFLYYKKE